MKKILVFILVFFLIVMFVIISRKCQQTKTIIIAPKHIEKGFNEP